MCGQSIQKEYGFNACSVDRCPVMSMCWVQIQIKTRLIRFVCVTGTRQNTPSSVDDHIAA